jgi:hypothetical protein
MRPCENHHLQCSFQPPTQLPSPPKRQHGALLRIWSAGHVVYVPLPADCRPAWDAEPGSITGICPLPLLTKALPALSDQALCRGLRISQHPPLWTRHKRVGRMRTRSPRVVSIRSCLRPAYGCRVTNGRDKHPHPAPPPPPGQQQDAGQESEDDDRD